MPTKSSSSTKRRTRTRSTGRKSNAAAPGAGAIEITNYPTALKYLGNRVDIERTRPRRISRDDFKLERMRALMGELGDPQTSLRCVHVAGTKGKGSTCALVAAGLEACGYTVGLYTSPHLVDVRERIQINGSVITHPAFTEGMQRIQAAEEKVAKKHGPLTYFEVVTALAFLYFAEKAVDVAVIECGLGGRLDSTNIIQPEVAAVTAISLDHEHYLGETVELIAQEKAGIFKRGAHAVTYTQTPEVLAALRQTAEQNSATLEVLGADIDFSSRFEATPRLGPHTCICLSSERSAYEHVNVPLPGEHQSLNCGLALAILDKLRERGFNTPEHKVIEGLTAVRAKLPGRMEMAWRSPRILIDGAHNPASITSLIRSIGAHVPYDSMVMIFGCAEDKNIRTMLEQVALGADKLIFTRAKGNARAADPEDLQQMFGEISGKMSQVARDLPTALEVAARAVGRDDLICVTGSFYLVGEAKKHLENLASKRAAAAKAGA